MIIHRPKNYEVPVYVMPCDEHDSDKNENNEQVCVDAALRYGYRLCLQMHKHLGLE
jgi:organic radical activating enzyme